VRVVPPDAPPRTRGVLRRYSHSAIALNFVCSCLVILEAVLLIGCKPANISRRSSAGLPESVTAKPRPSKYGFASARGPRLCAPIHGHAHAPVALRQLTPQRLHRLRRASQDRALQVAFEELGSRLEGKLGALVASGEHDWLEDEDSALYFELETLPGYSCNVSGRR
jgi:hypothetical protein